MMNLRRIAMGVGIGTCALAFYYCSSDSNPTTTNNTTSGCPAAGCGQNATCVVGSGCTCNAGFIDCNSDLATGGGCECNAADSCLGAQCGTGTCSTGTPKSCGASSNSYCNNGKCDTCTPNSYNCDFLNACEDTKPCGTTTNNNNPTNNTNNTTKTCSASKEFDCGKYQYCTTNQTCMTCAPDKYNCDGVNECEADIECGCDPLTEADCGAAGRFCNANKTCEDCATDRYNCDGINDCEESAPCIGTLPNGCEKECVEHAPPQCVTNPAAGNHCEECLDDSHCMNNTFSRGSKCDRTGLGASPDTPFCICDTDADCAHTKIGSRCYVAPGVPNPKLKQCGCKSDADCSPAAPHCLSPTGFGHCHPRCATYEDCVWYGPGLYCDLKTGRCEDPGGGM